MSPIERAARALCVADNHDPEEIVRKPEPIQFARPGIRSTIPQCPRWQTYVPKARAVLEAIREPSQRMLVKGGIIIADLANFGDAGGHAPASEYFPDARDAWSAMIGAALEEG